MLMALFCSQALVQLSAQTNDVGTLRALNVLDENARTRAIGYSWLEECTRSVGHRLTGSSNGYKAEAYADSLFGVCGLPVERFAFTAAAWSRGTVQFRVLSPKDAPAIEAVALANTPTSSSGEWDLVDLGNGLASDLAAAGDRARGRAVLMNLGLIEAREGASNLHRSEKTALAMRAGATAVVFVNNVGGHVLLTGTASVNGSLVEVPAVCISSESGAWIRQRLLANEPVRVAVGMTNRCDTLVAHDIIAEIPGTAHPEEVIIVGGHLDSWDLATGATDNGIGAFSIVDLARCFKELDFRPVRTVRFVLFMGEEQGLLGSRALVDHYRRSGALGGVKAMLNLDMSGHPKGFHVCGPAEWLDLVKRCSSPLAAIDTSFRALVDDHMGLHSDHQPFMLSGVPIIAPICDLGEHVYHCYHSSCDDIGLVDPEAMIDNVRFVGMLVYQLAMEGSLPDGLSQDALRKRLVGAGLEEPLRISGDWPWP